MKLDKIQQEIVNSKEKHIAVVAGSGSGKTKVLIERVRKIIEDGTEPSAIVAITFTNAAAGEMKTRLKDVPGIGDAFIGTIHSFANRVYKQSGLRYELLTSEKEIELFKSVLQDPRNIFNPKLTFERYLEWLDETRLVTKGELDPEDVAPNVFFLPTEYEGYKTAKNSVKVICKEKNIITFDELLEKTRDYFQTLGVNIKHVLVDEFQDVGLLEASFISGLGGENTLIVGDDWQNVYSFKGADVNIFKGIVRDPNTKVYYLENNYRSAKEILDLGKQVIDQVPDKIEKKVIIKNKNKGSVKIDSKKNVDKYLQFIKSSKNYKDWFILCRTNKDVYMLTNELAKMGVPVDTFKRDGMTNEQLDAQMLTDTVKVLTVHVSKGLENKNVMIYGNFPIKLPHWMKPNYEERRVLYVACTRAQENLIVLN